MVGGRGGGCAAACCKPLLCSTVIVNEKHARGGDGRWREGCGGGCAASGRVTLPPCEEERWDKVFFLILSPSVFIAVCDIVDGEGYRHLLKYVLFGWLELGVAFHTKLEERREEEGEGRGGERLLGSLMLFRAKWPFLWRVMSFWKGQQWKKKSRLFHTGYNPGRNKPL